MQKYFKDFSLEDDGSASQQNVTVYGVTWVVTQDTLINYIL